MTFGKERGVGGRESFGHFLKKMPTWMDNLVVTKILYKYKYKNKKNNFGFFKAIIYISERKIGFMGFNVS